MKVEIKVKKEVEITTLVVEANVRYWEDSTIDGVEDIDGNLTPCRVGEIWNPIINFDDGKIKNWKQGVSASVHFKVCDAGNYHLQDVDGNNVLSIKQDYVPTILCPKGGGYGDYIIMDIDKDGFIQNWKNKDISEFQDSEDED